MTTTTPWDELVAAQTRIAEKMNTAPVIREATLTSSSAVRFDTDTVDTTIYGGASGASVGSRVITVTLGHQVWVLGSASGGVASIPMNGTDAQPAIKALIDAGVRRFDFPDGAVVSINNPVAFPAGTVINANNVVFQAMRAFGTFGLTFAGNTTINGRLTLSSKEGDTAGIEVVGSNFRADSLHSLCSVGMGGVIGDGAVLSRSFGGLKTGITIRDTLFGNVWIGRLAVTGFEFSATIARTNGIKIDELQIRRYRRGLFLDDAKHVWINGGLISEAAPNAAPNPGHNGVILEATADYATQDIHFGGLTVRDAGEHGWRLGGAFIISRVWFNECKSINVGRGGFKVLGGEPAANNWHEDIWFNNCYVEDAGQQEINAGGIMIGYAKRVQINNPIIRAQNKPYSAGFAIHIIGSFDVTTTNPIVKDSMFAAYCVEYTKGDQTNIVLNGGQLHSHGTEALRIDWTQSGTDFRFINVEGFPILSVTGTGVMVRLIESGTLGGTQGTIYNTSHLTWQSGAAATVQVAGNGAYRVQADVRAPGFDPAVVLRDGSTWMDTNNGARRNKSVGTWTLQ